MVFDRYSAGYWLIKVIGVTYPIWLSPKWCTFSFNGPPGLPCLMVFKLEHFDFVMIFDHEIIPLEINPLMCSTWVLHIAKVWNFFSSPLPNAEELILRPLPFFFFLKLSIFHFFSNILLCPNLHNAVGDTVSFQLVQDFTNFFLYHLDRAYV